MLVVLSSRRLFLFLRCLGAVRHPFPHAASLPAPSSVHCRTGSDGCMGVAAGSIESMTQDQKMSFFHITVWSFVQTYMF